MPDTPETPAAGEVKTFTQDDLTAIATREREQGKRAGQTAADEALTKRLKDAGFDDGNLDTIIEAAKRATAADEAAKTQAQRDADAAAKAKTEAEALLATAARTLHEAKVTQALAGAVDVSVAARALDVEVGADDATIKAKVDELKAKVPGLFGAAPAPAPGSDPGNPPAQRDSRVSARDAAKAWADQRYKRT